MINIIKFGTSHCSMCKVMDNILDKGNIPANITKIHAEVNVDLVDKYNVKSVPVTILFDGDKEIHRWNGIVKENVIIEIIKQYESERMV